MSVNMAEGHLIIYVIFLTIAVFILFCFIACGHLMHYCSSVYMEETYEEQSPTKTHEPEFVYKSVLPAAEWELAMQPACYVDGTMIKHPNNQVYQPVVQPIPDGPATIQPATSHISCIKNHNFRY